MGEITYEQWRMEQEMRAARLRAAFGYDRAVPLARTNQPLRAETATTRGQQGKRKSAQS